MMVDWISGFVECPSWAEVGYQPYDTGHILVRDPTGEIRRIGTGKVLHEGSFDSTLTVSSSRGHDLYMSGNPAKHIQGHNLFGSADAVGLFLEAGLRIRQSVGLFPSPQTWNGNEFVGPRFTRLDVTRSYRFPRQQDARAWIREVAAAARSRHGAARLEHGETAYFGKGSEHWSFKVYAKFDEITSRKKGHRLSAMLSPAAHAELIEWAEGVVRFELTLRSKELQRLGTVSGCSPSETMRTIWQTYYDRITWNRNAAMSSDDLVERTLPRKLRMALIAWRAGADVRSMYPHRTWYRTRRELLDMVGVDIASPPPAAEASTVTPTLDSKGWDPEPLKAHVHEPDPELKKQYGLL